MSQDRTSPVSGDSAQTLPLSSSERFPHIPAERLLGMLLKGRYRLQGILGKGGMGLVIEAFDEELGRSVAVKVTSTKRSKIRNPDPRLIKEAKLLAKLSHPNVVQIYDANISKNDLLFVVMELIDGSSFHDLLKGGKLSPAECLSYLMPAGRGLAAVHKVGVVHRDFKPNNIMLANDGRVKVIDFGLSCEHLPEIQQDQLSGVANEPLLGVSKEENLTGTGAVMGTPLYMAPEQHEGLKIDHRADQFAFCVTLYQALTGQMPFGVTGNPHLLRRIQAGDINPISKSVNLPAGLEEILFRGLSYNPNDRYPSMDVLLGELEMIRTPRRRRWLDVVLGGVTGVGIFFGHQFMATDSESTDSGSEVIQSEDPEVPPCSTQAMNQMQEVWDNEAKLQFEALCEYAESQLDGLLLYRNINHLPQEWPTAETFDAYAYEWQNAYVSVCEDNNLASNRKDYSMECLVTIKNLFELTINDVIQANPDDAVHVLDKLHLRPISVCIPKK